MAGKRRDSLPANSGGTKPKTPPSHHGYGKFQNGTGNKTEVSHHGTGSKIQTFHGGRKVKSPVSYNTDRNFNSGNKLKTDAQHKDRGPGAKTPVHGKKTQRTMPELDAGFEKPHLQAPNSKLPRAIHKPSTLATIERRHSYTAGEAVNSKQRAGEKAEYSAHDIEKMVKYEIKDMKEKINTLMENLSQCTHGIEMIQREQNDIFHRYEAFLSRRTPDIRSKKHKKEAVHFPPLNQKPSLVGSGAKHGGQEGTDTSPMISNIKKIARKRSNELALREAETGNDADETRGKSTVKQTSSSEETRKSAKLKARDAVRRAAAQHFRNREKSATQPSEIQDILKQETIHKSDSKIAQMLRAHDTMAKVGKVSKIQKK